MKFRATLVVPMESSGQDKVYGMHSSSFSQYSKAVKVIAFILFWGKSYLVTIPRY
uniref:Uncharacterized protein n=1 Tax=Amphimedon queenslandica TaxID=400682 RepID=A0A1X7VG28_AMPQE